MKQHSDVRRRDRVILRLRYGKKGKVIEGVVSRRKATSVSVRRADGVELTVPFASPAFKGLERLGR